MWWTLYFQQVIWWRHRLMWMSDFEQSIWIHLIIGFMITLHRGHFVFYNWFGISETLNDKLWGLPVFTFTYPHCLTTQRHTQRTHRCDLWEFVSVTCVYQCIMCSWKAFLVNPFFILPLSSISLFCHLLKKKVEKLIYPSFRSSNSMGNSVISLCMLHRSVTYLL